MKILLGVLFLSLFLSGLSGCQQQKTDYERGYEDGQKVMINQFWQKLDAEAEMWEEWQIESENSLNESKKLKKWGIAAALSGALLFLVFLYFASETRKRLDEQKSEAENRLREILSKKDEALRTIELSKNSRKEFENAEEELSNLKTQIINLKREIEKLILAKAKAEQDYQIVQKRLDEISI